MPEAAGWGVAYLHDGLAFVREPGVPGKTHWQQHCTLVWVVCGGGVSARAQQAPWGHSVTLTHPHSALVLRAHFTTDFAESTEIRCAANLVDHILSEPPLVMKGAGEGRGGAGGARLRAGLGVRIRCGWGVAEGRMSRGEYKGRVSRGG